MNIDTIEEFDSDEADRADRRGEAWIRVLTNKPIGPQDWDAVYKRVKETRPWFFDKYEGMIEKFRPELTELEEGETEYAPGFGFEQWFVVAEKRH